MKTIYDVVWSEAAEHDLIDLIQYVAANNPSNASSVFKQLKQKAKSLCSSPNRGRIVPELQDQGVSIYRELIIPPWRVIYRVSEKTVYVLAILDSRRNIEDILLRKLIR